MMYITNDNPQPQLKKHDLETLSQILDDTTPTLSTRFDEVECALPSENREAHA